MSDVPRDTESEDHDDWSQEAYPVESDLQRESGEDINEEKTECSDLEGDQEMANS